MSDWQKQLAESVELADRMAQEIPPLLADPDLTHEQASQLFESVNARCLMLGHLIDTMADNGADQDLLDAGDEVEEIWATIAEAIVERIMSFRKH